MVGVLSDQAADPEGLEKFFLVRLQSQCDGRSPCRFLRPFQRVAAVAAGSPAHRLAGFGAGTPAEHFHLLGDDERRIEADPELADEGGVLAGLAVEGFKEPGGPRVRDGPQLLDDFLTAHADAVVADGQGAGIGIQGDLYAQFRLVVQKFRLAERFEAQSVVGVGGVGNQLAEENLLVAVQGVHHQVQQLFHLGLEIEGSRFPCVAHR